MLCFMAAIGRFQKGDDIFFAKVVDGELFRLQGDVFGSPSFEKKPVPLKGVKTLTPVSPTKIIAVGLNYADHARESGKPVPKEPLFWLKAPTSLISDGGKVEIPRNFCPKLPCWKSKPESFPTLRLRHRLAKCYYS